LESRREDLDHRQHLIGQQREFIKDSSRALKITVDNLFALKDRSQQLISETQFEQVLATLDRIITIQDDLFFGGHRRLHQDGADGKQGELPGGSAIYLSRLRDGSLRNVFGVRHRLS